MVAAEMMGHRPKLATGEPATLFLLCGLPGAGKTTEARRLERERAALRLAEDVWIARLFPPAAVHDDDARDAVKAVQWAIASRVLTLGVNVVLDWGFWARVERDDFRARAAALGVACELVYLAASEAALWRRLNARNAALPPDTFPVTRAQLREWIGWFDPPAPDEAARVITADDEACDAAASHGRDGAVRR